MIPIVLRNVNFQNGILATPAGSEMKVRITGIIRDARGIPLEAATININDDAGPLIGAETDASGTYSVVVAPGHYTIEAFAPFRGDMVSLAPQDITVNGFTRMDFVLQDANP